MMSKFSSMSKNSIGRVSCVKYHCECSTQISGAHESFVGNRRRGRITCGRSRCRITQFVGSVASHYLTPYAHFLHIEKTYAGNSRMCVVNGHSLATNYVGSSNVVSKSSLTTYLTLNDILYVPFSPSPHPSSSGIYYHITFVDAYIQYNQICFLKQKSKEFHAFKLFLAFVKTLFHIIIKDLQSDYKDNSGPLLNICLDQASYID